MHNAFTERYPVAFHVFPLHRARALWASGKLLGKQDLPESATRRTTRDVDRALGLGNVVHFYLGRGSSAVTELPILTAQTKPSSTPAIPHAVLELETSALALSEVTVCNWNIAVSRPAVEGVCKGGNWTRGTNPNRIAEVWRRFRYSEPGPRRARGFWKRECLVPLLEGAEVVDHINFLSKAAGGRPELILDSGFEIARCARVLVFSERDRESIALAGKPPGDLPIEVVRLADYGDDSVGGHVRAEVEGELRGSHPARLDFDAIRPSL
jgi:hypothetical protein